MSHFVKYIGILLLLLLPICLSAQLRYREDFQTWFWLQVRKKTFSHQYFEAQYQLRLVNNASTFGRANLYAIYGYNWAKRWNTEVLYQLATNHQIDQHTLYIGTTYNVKLARRLYLFARTAFQYTNNHFSGEYKIDKPIYEWRNRVRISYNYKQLGAIALSAEPYLAYDQIHPVYLGRVRYVAQCNLRYNRFVGFSAYYLIQPDIVTYKRLDRNYVVGLTCQIKLPNKWKDYDKIHKPKFLKYFRKSNDKDNDDEPTDTFN